MKSGVAAVAIVVVVVAVSGYWLSGHNQIADDSYDVSVARAANTRLHPTVCIDAAHHNFATAEIRAAGGRSQGVAFELWRGRVVVLGEAAMLTAQVTGRGSRKFGMNWPNNDDRQLALNIVHWLSRALD